MTDTFTPAPQPGNRIACRAWQLLGIFIIISTALSAMHLLTALVRRFDAIAVWLALAGDLPLIALSVAGSIALVRGQKAGCWLIGAAAVLSILRWPFPSVPFFNHWLHLPVRSPFAPMLESSLLQWVNGLVMLLMTVCYRLTRNAAAEERFQAWFRLRPVLVLAGIFIVLAGRALLIRQLNATAAVLYARGIEASIADRPDEAIALRRQIADQYPYTRSWGMALLNTSYALRQQQRWAEAIPPLEELLASDLNYTDPSLYLIRRYQNYHHEACWGLVGYYENLENYRTALHYAELARDVYLLRFRPGSSYISQAESGWLLRMKIGDLERKVNETE